MAKQPRKREKTPRAVIVAAFGDLPIWEATLDAFGVPHSLARRGFFCYLGEHSSKVFEQHPERGRLPAKAVDAAMALVEAVVDGCRWHLTMSLGRYDVGAVQLQAGFHLDLDAKALAAAYERDGFQVLGVDALGEGLLTGIAGRVKRKAVWPFVTAALERGIAIGPVLEAVASSDTPRPSARLFDTIAASLAPGDLPGYRKLLETLGEDLVARSLPVIERLCGARTKQRTTGLPAPLATVLAVFDGIPALGVLTPADIAKTAAAESKAPRRPWNYISERVRGDRAWRPEWTPFARAGGRLICIDDAPSTQGTKGQIIGVSREPAELHHEAGSLDDWLWTKLAAITPATAAARPARARSPAKASRATARAR